ncbi:MAG TPA: Na+/H+ antiporter NhaC family protein [Polyangiaceae bacterium]|nr:Na+/H+ antiporter NhaC family protein [Polyangiaceae bacterium]
MLKNLRERPGALGAAVLAILAVLFLPQLPSVRLESGFSAGPQALVPPVVAICAALSTRRLLFSLASAVIVGAVLRHGGQVWSAGFSSYVVDNASDSAHLYIIGFTLALLGMVQTAARSGGAEGIVAAVARRAKTRRGAQVSTWAMGLLVFFDDYANCMLVGPTMRPLTDKLRISREKLAFLIDATAAPVAGIVIISTWVGYETGLLDDVSKSLALSTNGYALLLEGLPLRFYCILTLGFVLANAWSGRDFGPMLRAERRALSKGKLVRDGATLMGSASLVQAEEDTPHPSPRWSNAAAPVALVVVATLIGLVVDGGGAGTLSAQPTRALSVSFWRETLGASENNTQVLFIAAALGALCAIVLPALRKDLALKKGVRAFAQGAWAGVYAVFVLLLAWALAQVCKDLGTGPVVIAALGKSLPHAAVPAVTFLAAAAVAFSTGTSWGTMAILIPTALPIAHELGGMPLLILTVASVLDGAIFGDHCSPISDTTLMSSIAAGSDHLDHVGTQLPYACVVMCIALLGGYVPVALGAPIWLSYAACAALIVTVLFVFGRRAEVAD